MEWDSTSENKHCVLPFSPGQNLGHCSAPQDVVRMGQRRKSKLLFLRPAHQVKAWIDRKEISRNRKCVHFSEPTQSLHNWCGVHHGKMSERQQYFVSSHHDAGVSRCKPPIWCRVTFSLPTTKMAEWGVNERLPLLDYRRGQELTSEVLRTILEGSMKNEWLLWPQCEPRVALRAPMGWSVKEKRAIDKNYRGAPWLGSRWHTRMVSMEEIWLHPRMLNSETRLREYSKPSHHYVLQTGGTGG